MLRDIDKIIKLLITEFPEIQISQLQVAHPGIDDDGIWFIKHPTRSQEIQLESPDGNCPFIIETDLNNKSYHGLTVDRAVSIVRILYSKHQ